MIYAVRVYDVVNKDALGALPAEAKRYLVDRIWPRGIAKDALGLDGWTKEAAPNDSLRRWYGHTAERWEYFRSRYLEELNARPEAWNPLLEAARQGDVLLLYAARDEERNNAVVLREFLEKQISENQVGNTGEIV